MKKLSEYTDEEIIEKFKNNIEIYKSGVVVLEDISLKLKLNRVELSLLNVEINKRGIKIEENE